MWELIVGALLLPIICLAITLVLARYLRESLDRQIAGGVMIGGTLGYMISMSLVIIFG
jgi:TRAP-type mannitol/chloroaromatic compound transport system permease large subunit